MIIHYIQFRMELLQRVAKWFEYPTMTTYRCSNCATSFEDAVTVCPECGGDIEATTIPAAGSRYWMEA